MGRRWASPLSERLTRKSNQSRQRLNGSAKSQRRAEDKTQSLGDGLSGGVDLSYIRNVHHGAARPTVASASTRPLRSPHVTTRSKSQSPAFKARRVTMLQPRPADE